MEISEENRYIFKKAMDLFGFESQIDVLKEELGELLMELLRMPRNRTTEDKIIEEIADVQIMVWQAAMFLGEKKVDEVIDQKIKRLNKMIS